MDLVNRKEISRPPSFQKLIGLRLVFLEAEVEHYWSPVSDNFR